MFIKQLLSVLRQLFQAMHAHSFGAAELFTQPFAGVPPKPRPYEGGVM